MPQANTKRTHDQCDGNSNANAPVRTDTLRTCDDLGADSLTVTDEQWGAVEKVDTSTEISVAAPGDEDIDFFSTLLQQGDLSTRLRHILQQANRDWKGSASVSDFLLNKNEFRTFVLNRWGLGGKTRRELISSLSAALAEGVYVFLDKEVDSRPRHFKTEDSRESSDHDEVETQPSVNERVRSPENLVNELLSSVPKRECQVACRRFGLNGFPEETLEAIGRSYGVTRERVRQIQKRFLGRLQTDPMQTRVRKSLATYYQSIWSDVSANSAAVFHGDIGSAWDRLSPELHITIEAAYGSLEQWLDAVAPRASTGWLRSTSDLEVFKNIEEQIDTGLIRIPKPYPLENLEIGHVAVTIDEIGRLAREKGWETYNGYVLGERGGRPGLRGRRVRRSVELHRSLLKFGRQAVRLPTLLLQYHSDVEVDHCSVRDARIVMEKAPHLFLSVTEDEWVAVNRTPAPREGQISIETQWREVREDTSNVEENTELDTIAGVLSEVLRTYGPLRFKGLRAEATKRLPRATAVSSIGVVVLTSGYFRRIAPGLYGLPQQSEACAEGRLLPSGLFEEDQCKWYAAARWCGCSGRDFPAWHATYEKALAEWAESDLERRTLFRSLLAVIEPRNWPITDSYRSYWERLQNQNSRYELEQEPPWLADFIPPLERVLAAAVKALTDGGINWMRINRTIQKRIDFQGAASVLGLLSLLGVLRAPGHWQRWHPILPDAEHVVKGLVQDLERTGEVAWTERSGHDLIRRARERLGADLETWAPHAELNALVQALEPSDSARSKGEPVDSEESDPLAEARKDARKRRLYRRSIDIVDNND